MTRTIGIALLASVAFGQPGHAQTGWVGQVSAANRAATRQPQQPGFVNAAQIYPFADGAIYQVYTAPGAITDIELQPGEVLVAVASGDTARWVIGDTASGSGAEKRTHILVKPFAPLLQTNMIITTDRRAYHLRLTSTASTAMASLRWNYPQDELIAVKRASAAAEAARPVADGLDIEKLHFNYVVTGDRPEWRPLRAFDDGRQTFIEFPVTISQGEAPPLFIIGTDNKAELVNYRVRDRFYVVDRIFGAAELRMGLKKQQVVRIMRMGAPRGSGA